MAELLDCLQNLDDGELKTFKLYLQDEELLKDYMTINMAALQNADRHRVVRLMKQTFESEAEAVAALIFATMKRNDLATKLDDGQS